MPARPPAQPGAPRVVALGLATLDHVQWVDHVPGPDEKVQARRADLTFGGPAANAAAAAVGLGCPTALITAIGAAELAEVVRYGLARAGVDVIDLAASGYRLPVSEVMLTESTHSRAVVSVNAAGAGPLAALRPALLEGADAALVDGHLMERATQFAAQAQAVGVPVVMDGGSWKPGSEALLAHVDLAVVSADFHLPGTPGHAGDHSVPDPRDAATLAGVAAMGPRWVAMSRAAAPLLVRWPDASIEELPVPAVPQVVDTLGAGDALHGGIVASLAHTMRARASERPNAGRLDLTDADIRLALQEGLATAAASVAAPGARGWIDA
ncbi:MAG: PfkB family carbohydrate kinase [Bifidobacteriaceae bacterium]|nr:PfkB family carbohydrate kinase [Bifidobacteriaceae bacterium]